MSIYHIHYGAMCVEIVADTDHTALWQAMQCLDPQGAVQAIIYQPINSAIRQYTGDWAIWTTTAKWTIRPCRKDVFVVIGHTADYTVHGFGHGDVLWPKPC